MNLESTRKYIHDDIMGYSRKNPHPPPTDGMLEILVGGGVEGSGNLGGRGSLNQKILPQGSFSTRTYNRFV